MVGDLLRRGREKKNLTIADVEKETSISKKYLEALEKGEYDKMPGDVYIKGFIRNYAKCVGMDGDELLREFASERGIEVPPQPMKLSTAEEIVKSEATVRQPKVKVTERETVRPSAKAFSSGDDFKSRTETGSPLKKIFMGLGIAVFAFLAAVYIIFSDENTAPGAKPPVQTQAETKVEETKKEETKPVVNPDEIKVLVKLVDRCWMKVTVDGAVAFEGTAEPGLEMDWTGKKDVLIVAGNAGAVELILNGKSAGKLGEIGQVAERHITKEAATSQPAQVKTEAASQPATSKPAESKHITEPVPAPVVESQPVAPEAVQPASQPSAPVDVAPAAEQAPAPTPSGNVAKTAQ